MPRLSIIMPALNEADTLQGSLEALRALRVAGHELILVDGGSEDDTREIARPWVDRLVETGPGRARQMNAGAGFAQGDVVLFLHADTRLPAQADHLIRQALTRHRWGRFDVRLSGRQWLLRWVERMMNWRSCLSGIATGDQAIFIERSLFIELGGFPDLPLMEDIAMSKRLKRSAGRPACLRPALITSSRRWEEEGIVRTILLMWRLRLAYFLGVPPQRLAQHYRYRRPAEKGCSG